MDPFSALAVATAATQFFDCASGVLRELKRRADESRELTQESFDKVTKDLLSFTKVMGDASGFTSDSAPGASWEPHEVALRRLVGDCRSVANELVDTLSSLKRKAKQRRWTSFVQALETVWKAERINELRQQISAYRSEMVLRVLASINAKMDASLSQQSDHLRLIEQRGEEITGVLAFNHSEIREAILTMKNGDSRTISRDDGTAIGTSQSSGSIIRLDGPADGEGPRAIIKDLKDFGRAILDMLHFRQIHDRFESIKEAHRKTFEWVFADPTRTARPWSGFPEWLEQGSGCYWVQGKAGSGKSTMMKFIYRHSRTHEHLRKWSRGGTLTTASFFFWYIGSSIQKSQEGLLRSLLHDILRTSPWLMKRIMPELFVEGSKQLMFTGFDPPSLSELMRWYVRLGDEMQKNVGQRICFFLDGIDEYTGNHNDLLKLCLDLASKTDNIKFVLSSRPIPDCVDMLSACPGLRLQDLTLYDIRKYAADLLQQKAILVEQDELQSLLNEVVSKSCGVFLWVALVVRSLLEGLRNGDTLEELRKRLDEMPSELGSLYQHMLDRIPESYRTQAAEMLRLMAVNFGQGPGSPDAGYIQPLPAIQLSYALDTKDDVLNEGGTGEITRAEATSRIRQIDARVRSRCLGLLELQWDWHSAGVVSMYRRPSVEFIHRTVLEFLNDPEVSTQLGASSASSGFNPYIALFRSSLWMLKKTNLEDSADLHKAWEGPPWEDLSSALFLANSSELIGSAIPPLYLDELDKILSKYWRQYHGRYHQESLQDGPASNNGLSDTHWFQAMLQTSPHKYSVPQLFHHTAPVTLWEVNMKTDQFGLQEKPSITKAITVPPDFEKKIIGSISTLGFHYMCLLFPLSSFLDQRITTLQQNDLDLLLDFSIHKGLLVPFPMCGYTAFSEHSATAFETLFKAGANPNFISYSGDREYTIWAVFLGALMMVFQGLGVPSLNWSGSSMERIFKAFITHGADISVRFELGNKTYTPETSMLHIQRSLQKAGAQDTPLYNAVNRIVSMLESSIKPGPPLRPYLTPAEINHPPLQKPSRPTSLQGNLGKRFSRLMRLKAKNVVTADTVDKI